MELWLQCPWLSTLYWEKKVFSKVPSSFLLAASELFPPFPDYDHYMAFSSEALSFLVFLCRQLMCNQQRQCKIAYISSSLSKWHTAEKKTTKKSPHKTQKPKPPLPPPHTKSKSFPSAAFDPEADLCLQVNNCFLLVSYILYLGLVWYKKCNQGIFRYPRPEKKDKTSQSLIFNPK